MDDVRGYSIQTYHRPFPFSRGNDQVSTGEYDQAEAGDVIWAQCVRCTDFTPEVRTKIQESAVRGVRFQMVINQHSPAAGPFEAATLEQIQRQFDTNVIGLMRVTQAFLPHFRAN